MITKTQSLPILEPYLFVLNQLIFEAFEAYFLVTEGKETTYCSRTRTAMINDHMIELANERLVPMPGVVKIEACDRTLFEIGGEVLLHFKKLDANLKPSNYRTQTAIRFNNNLELDGIPSELPRIQVGYVPKDDWTSIIGAFAAYNGSRGWSIDITGHIAGIQDIELDIAECASISEDVPGITVKPEAIPAKQSKKA